VKGITFSMYQAILGRRKLEESGDNRQVLIAWFIHDTDMDGDGFVMSLQREIDA